MYTYRALCVLLLATYQMPALAQTPASNETGPSESVTVRSKHTIELSVGLLTDVRARVDASVGDVGTQTEANGLLGSLTYNLWLEDDLAIGLSIGVSNAAVETSATIGEAGVESAVVIPLLFGVKYAPSGLAVGDALRPNVYAYVGPYFGLASNVQAGRSTGTESYQETALGTRIGIGADLSLGRSFYLGLGLGYRLVSDFDKPIGSAKNHSSPELSLSFGFGFGKR